MIINPNLITSKDILWNLLQESCKEIINENLFFLYGGHGWSHTFIVLYTKKKDYLFKMEKNEKIKIISDDGDYKNIIPILDLNELIKTVKDLGND